MSGRVNADAAQEGPKYQRIYLELREALAIGTYSPGDKLPGENDLAERFGASRPTVRRALSQLESEGFVDRRMGSGTVVANRQDRKAYVFGLLIPELGMTEIFEPICQGISQAHSGGQHDLLWGPTFSQGGSKESQAEQLCRYYIERKVSGVFFAPIELVAGGDAINLSIARAFDEAQIPIVLLDRDICLYPERSKYDVVGIDNRRAGYVLTEHLLLCESHRVAFFAQPFSAHTVDARMAGYREAIRAHQGSAAPDLAHWIHPSDVNEVRKFLNEFQPDAIACANDYTAAQLLTTLNTLGVQVPSQVRVAGIDDVKYARLLQSPLTTIHQPCLEIGSTALLAMLDRIAHPDSPSRDFLVDFKLVTRESTAPNEHLRSKSRNPRPSRRADKAISNHVDTSPERTSSVMASPVDKS
jgi:GntR family transcriptional regulator, arabinose operon transcriptional repressor